jgi:hypothetical protein
MTLLMRFVEARFQFGDGGPGDDLACHYGRYLADYDPSGNMGAGRIVTTDDPAKALRFESLEQLMLVWKATSQTHPIRADGLPNRPLTALNVAVAGPGVMNDPGPALPAWVSAYIKDKVRKP